MKEDMLPNDVEIIDIKQETGSNLNIKTFKLRFVDGEIRESFSYKPGQFMMVTVPGVGEAPFGFASSPTQDNIELSVKEVGLVTEEIHNLQIGDKIGVRGPYGNGFPVKESKGKNIVFIGGGIGLAPLRSLINYVLDKKHRDEFGKVQLLNAFRSPVDNLYTYDFEWWESSPDTT